jgi:hypothetical protein
MLFRINGKSMASGAGVVNNAGCVRFDYCSLKITGGAPRSVLIWVYNSRTQQLNIVGQFFKNTFDYFSSVVNNS